VLPAEVEDPTGYGRIVRRAGAVERVVEHADADRAERAIREVNVGIYCAGAAELLRVLRRLRPDNAQGEYYITDAVRAFIAAGQSVAALLHDDAAELLGVNTRQELAAASRALYSRSAARLQDAGVTLLDPARTWIDPRARIGRDSIVYPGVFIEGESTLGEDCVVGPGCRLIDVRIGAGVEIKDHSVVVESQVGPGAKLGPFAHLRPGSVLEADARVGNFVELKKTRLGRGSKASHLTYLGDAEVGPGCNIGAGTITCNYDGERKHRTVIGRGVFVGSNTQIVAPVHVHDGAYVAAGSTVTEDVPPGALAIARSRQRNVPGWTERNRKPAAKAKKR
jgi:bifunctional UDP-N-acetylglucosamine pyrophosphorylase/glucosamine-1-phosphate N-acetyltransferase